MALIRCDKTKIDTYIRTFGLVIVWYYIGVSKPQYNN